MGRKIDVLANSSAVWVVGRGGEIGGIGGRVGVVDRRKREPMKRSFYEGGNESGPFDADKIKCRHVT